MALSAGTRLGSYEIVSPLGAGGMGEVYRARHLKLGRDAAIKVLPGDVASEPERLRRFEREARAASALNHPNIVTIHDIDEEDGTHYIAMELVEGRTLRELLVDAPLPLGRLLGLARQVAEGLARAHAAGIVHRDLKPENLMVTDDGLVKILDFGLAKLGPGSAEAVSDASTAEQATRAGVVLGTVPYMSPEQAAGRSLDYRSDQFSFGSILYEMASGRRAFKRATTPQTLAAIIESEPEALGRLNDLLPASLIAIVERCLAKDPGRRFESTRELAAALQAVPETSPFSWIPRAAWALGGLAAVILAGELLPRSTRFWHQLIPGASAPRIQAIAVLPLQNLSGDPAQEYFADGMTEALITDLSKIGALRVISRSSAMRYKGTRKTLAEIARELGVDAIMEGSVVREGGRVGVTAQLVEAAADRTLWAERFDREVRSILALQGEIARAVARQVQVTLTPEEQSRLSGAREVDPLAHEAYLRGSFHLKKLTKEGIEKGLEYLREAVERDPQSALAHGSLALGYSLAASHSAAPPKDAFGKAQAAYRRALELDDTLAEAHAALAETKLYQEWDFPGARKAFERALALNPSLASAHVHYAWYLNLVGRQDEAVAEMQRARQLDPLEPLWIAWFGDLHWAVGQHYEMAVTAAREAFELDPNLPWGYITLGLGLAGQGRFDEAIAAHTTAAELNPAWRATLAATYAKAGQREKARELAAAVEASKERDAFLLTAVYSALGDHDEALRCAEQAIDGRHPFAPWLFRWVDIVEPLKANPRYLQLRTRMGLAPDATGL